MVIALKSKTIPVVDLEKKMKSIKKPWIPIDLAIFNDHVARLSFFKGEHHFHSHEKDQIFYVLKGKVKNKMKKGKDVELSKGELALIPKNTEHCPTSVKGAHVLIFEPLSVHAKQRLIKR